MNKKILIVSSIVFLGLIFGIYQCFQVFETENVSAVNIGTPISGHPWSQMECSGDTLCVDITNKRVGIGTNNPTEKFEVNGSIKASGSVTATGNFSTSGSVTATGDICGAGACLSQIASFVANQPLINNVHNQGACTSAGGTIVPSSGSYPQCRFDAATCPSGWTQYQSWMTTFGVVCVDSCGSCTPPSHTWANIGPDTCTYNGGYPCVSSNMFSKTCSATITQIGCY
jgi:hypothetical protein